MTTYRKTSRGFTTATIRLKDNPTTCKTFRTKKMAQAWAQRTEDAMRLGEWQEGSDMLLSDLLHRYEDEIVPLKKTSKFHHTNIQALDDGLGETPLQALDAGHVVDYVKTRRKSKTRLGPSK